VREEWTAVRRRSSVEDLPRPRCLTRSRDAGC
jgi:hypothetical protein